MRSHQHKFVALDGMRGLAALTVMALHYRDYFLFNSPAAAWIVPNGGTAVDLFFALSGFVLAYAYEHRFVSGLGTAKFMALRFVRIYPLYLLGTLVALIVSIATWRIGYWRAPLADHVGEFASGLLFVPLICSGCRFFPLNFPAWSLLIELIANLFYRVFFRALSRWVLVTITVVCFFGVAWTCESENDLGVGSLVADLFRIGYSFPFGVLLYRWWEKGHIRSGSHALVPIGAMLAFFFLPIQYYAFLGTLLAFPLLIYVAACNEPRGWLSKILSELGDASFAVYMFHIPVLQAYKWLVPETPAMSGATRLITYFALMGLVFGFAVIADRIYDIPVRRILNRLVMEWADRLSPPVITRQSGERT